MRILLDTSYIYNLTLARWNLSDTDKSILSDQRNQFYVSAVSIWEMRLKFNARDRLGKRKSKFNPEDVVRMLKAHNVIFLPMTPSHAACRLEIPVIHKDPFDELLLVQAQQEGLRFLTVDRQMSGHPLVINKFLI